MRLLLLLLILVSTGCVGGRLTEHGRVVPISVGDWRGTGAVVGADLVVTVAHVIKHKGTIWAGDGRAEVIKRFPDPRTNDDIVLLRVRWLFDCPPEEWFKVRKGHPWWVHTLKGSHSYYVSEIIPGDSGSATVDEPGWLVGSVSARWCNECGTTERGGVPWVLDDQWTEASRIPESFKLPK